MNAFIVILLFCDLITAAVATVKMLNSYNSSKRGTNAVTRFVRDVSANVGYNKCQIMSVLGIIMFGLPGLIFGGGWAILVVAPTVATLVLSFVLKAKSTNNEQRVKDARVVTKGSLEVGAAVAETGLTAAGAVAGTSTGVGAAAGAKIGKAVGGSVATISDKAAQSMTDVDSLGITKEDMKGINDVVGGVAGGIQKVSVPDPTRFMEAAQRVGIGQAGEDPQVVAARVFAQIPESLREKYQGKPEGELAMLFLEGKV